MSRHTIFSDNRLTVVKGQDHALGLFIQIFDKHMMNETPEGEGLVYEWSELFGVEINYTGQPSSLCPDEIFNIYINENKEDNEKIT